MKPYVRIRVTLNIGKPLKRRMRIKREGGNWQWINFKYERSGNFCFVCGVLGHVERECNVVYANPGKEFEKAYAVWLKATNRNVRNNVGARWLRNLDGGAGWREADEGGSRNPMTSDSGNVTERFAENAGIVRENGGDKGSVMITTRNQEQIIMEGGNLNLNEELEEGNIILENKRKRIDRGKSWAWAS